MIQVPSGLIVWGWVFMLGYVGLMIFLGSWGRQRVATGDDFAVARGAYGPLTLSIAFAATIASGATFLGLPGFAYTYGISALWVGLVYPVGVYLGIFLCQRVVIRLGNQFGNRSIPEFLGDRYQSEAIRILSAVASLALLFYLAAQLVGGLAMFEVMLGLDKPLALGLTSRVLLVYVAMGGAHADILTDTVQGVLMLVIAVGVAWMFLTGFGVVGGFEGMLARLETLDPLTIAPINEEFALVNGLWAFVAMILAYIPLGMLPHIGNKLWALKDPRSQRRFILSAFCIGLIFPLLTLGGLLARAVLGDALFEGELTPNSALPALFIEVFPAWLAALLGAAVLASIMSTADGLVISASQVFANDIYRRTVVPRWRSHLMPEQVDRSVLVISRWATAGTMLVATVIAWYTFDMNIILVTWIGIGGLTAALAGSLVLGVFWRRATAPGAIAGFVIGLGGFIALHAGWLPTGGALLGWLSSQAPNPYACATIAGIVAVTVTVLVSLATKPLPQDHLDKVFGSAET